MAALVDNSVKHNAVGGMTSLTTGTFALGSGASNTVLYALVGCGAGSPVDPSSVTWNGGGGESLTQIGTTINVGSYEKISVWRKIAPTAATNSITASFGSSVDEVWIIGVSVKDADQTTPNGTVAQNSGTTTTPSATAATVSGDLVLSFMSWLDLSGSSRTCTASDTSIQEIEGGANGMVYEGAGSSYGTASGATKAMNWTLSGSVTRWGEFAFAINAAAVGGGANHNNLTLLGAG